MNRLQPQEEAIEVEPSEQEGEEDKQGSDAPPQRRQKIVGSWADCQVKQLGKVDLCDVAQHVAHEAFCEGRPCTDSRLPPAAVDKGRGNDLVHLNCCEDSLGSKLGWIHFLVEGFVDVGPHAIRLSWQIHFVQLAEGVNGQPEVGVCFFGLTHRVVRPLQQPLAMSLVECVGES